MTNYKNNIIEFYTRPNFNQLIGSNWYKNARNDINEIILLKPFLEFKVPLKIGVYIVSILSPANKWDNNLWDFHFFLDQVLRGQSLDHKFTTYGTNVNKAKNLFRDYLNGVSCELLCDDYLGKKTSLKTLNFAQSILNDTSDQYFTIDRHMLKIAGFKSNSVTYRQYFDLKAVYFEAFLYYRYMFKSEVSFVNFQAILWANYVNFTHNIKHY